MPLKCLHLLVHGHVQGVGFRYYAKDLADAAGVSGWVRNVQGGRVEAVVQGPAGKVDDLIALLKKGPPWGKVSEIEVVEEPFEEGLVGFTIRY